MAVAVLTTIPTGLIYDDVRARPGERLERQLRHADAVDDGRGVERRHPGHAHGCCAATARLRRARA